MKSLKNCRLDDQVCIVVYFDTFDRKMSYLLREKEPKTLHQTFMTTIEIENNIEYGLTKDRLLEMFSGMMHLTKG